MAMNKRPLGNGESDDLLGHADSNLAYYGEWVEILDDGEKGEALQYLELWKKFILRKLKGARLIDSQIVEKHIDIPGLEEKRTVGIKLALGSCR